MLWLYSCRPSRASHARPAAAERRPEQAASFPSRSMLTATATVSTSLQMTSLPSLKLGHPDQLANQLCVRMNAVSSYKSDSRSPTNCKADSSTDSHLSTRTIDSIDQAHTLSPLIPIVNHVSHYSNQNPSSSFNPIPQSTTSEDNTTQTSCCARYSEESRITSRR